jgi:hypothetical protein
MNVPDGAGGVFISWVVSGGGVFVQRLDAMGTILWAAGGIAVCTASSVQDYPRIIAVGSDAIITWTDLRVDDGDIYAQRIDGSGNLLWDSGGIAVSAESGAQNRSQIISDGAGGVFLSWKDERNEYLKADIFVQRLNAMGNAYWRSNGIPLCAAPGEQGGHT